MAHDLDCILDILTADTADLRKLAHIADAEHPMSFYSGATLTGADLRNQNLSGFDFSYADLRNADLRGANLLGAKFFQAKMNGCQFDLSIMEQATDFPPSFVFQDAPYAPEMVVIPGGTFLMGSPENEEGHRDIEGPQHEVTVPRFALGRYAVTFEEYDAFCDEMGTEKPDDRDWGRGRRPVINVSWDDAVAYIDWLSGKTGQAYRLPSEAEWEYACRAGTTTPFSFGTTISTDQANYDGNVTYGNGSKGVRRGKTVPVDEFAPNALGLYQMHGNVWEWCADHWHGDYQGAPTDGSAWLTGGDSSLRVLRGGSWGYAPYRLRSAIRNLGQPVNRVNLNGFRVARTL